MNIDKINVGGNLYDVCDTNARAMISDEYNSATQYSAGDYCIWENTLKKANKSTTGTYDHTAWDDANIGEVVGELNQKINTEYEKILEITELTGSGTIPGFSNYKEFVIAISASGYVLSHYLAKNMIGVINLQSSYYYDSTQHAMAAIQIKPDGSYTLAPGMKQNSANSTIVIYAR